MIRILFTCTLFFTVYILLAFNNSRLNPLTKPLTNDHYIYIAINAVKMWVANNGDGSHDPTTDGSGFYWPGGEDATQTAIFEDGLIFAGFYGDSMRLNGNVHRQGLQAGKILPDGTADSPDLEKYRIYRIRRDWNLLPPGPQRDAFEKDYNEWPVEDGAPWEDVNLDGIFTQGVDHPKYIGDETLWYVANGADTNRATFTYGSPPMGLEFQTTIYGYNRTGWLGNAVFKKYLIINKSDVFIDSMFIGYWTDDDVGYAGDDAVGCDTLLQLGYTYNYDWEDDLYDPPPAVGHMLIQGPIIPASLNDSAKFMGRKLPGFKNLLMTSFIFFANGWWEYPDPSSGQYQGSLELYNYLNGLMINGDPLKDPFTGSVTKFAVSGDPTSGEGWDYRSWPDGPGPQDVRFVLSSGPFEMAPGDSQEVEFAIFIAAGESHLHSISKLKEDALEIHKLFGNEIVSKRGSEDNIHPQKYSLNQNYPNPFNSITKIEFNIPQTNHVIIEVFNTLGQTIETILNKSMSAGNHEVTFNAEKLPSGIYFYRIQVGEAARRTAEFQDVKKMVLLR